LGIHSPFAKANTAVVILLRHFQGEASWAESGRRIALRGRFRSSSSSMFLEFLALTAILLCVLWHALARPIASHIV
jgi:hypothetical protein